MTVKIINGQPRHKIECPECGNPHGKWLLPEKALLTALFDDCRCPECKEKELADYQEHMHWATHCGLEPL